MKTFELVKECCEQGKDLAYFKKHFRNNELDDIKLITVGTERIRYSALSLAVLHKRLDLVNALLDAGSNPNTSVPNALFLAVNNIVLSSTNYSAENPTIIPIIKILLDKNANPNLAIRLTDQSSALHLAAQENSIAVTKWLIDKGADINHINATGVTPVFVPAQRGHFHIVSMLCNPDSNNKQVINLNPLTIKYINGQIIMSPLSAAAQKKNLNIVKSLLNYVKAPHVTEAKNILIFAIQDACAVDDNDNVLRMLINHSLENHSSILGKIIICLLEKKLFQLVVEIADNSKAELNKKYPVVSEARKIIEITPLLILINSNCPTEIISAFISKGADLNIKNNGNTLLSDVVLMKKTRILDFLLNTKKIEINTENDQSCNQNNIVTPLTALELAAHNGSIEEAKILLQHGANYLHQNRLGFNAVYYATMRKQWEILKLFLNKDDQIINKHYATRVGNFRLIHYIIDYCGLDSNFSNEAAEILEELSKQKATVSAMPSDSASPLTSAVAHNSLACARKLIALGANPNEIHNGVRCIHVAMSLNDDGKMIRFLATNKTSLNYCNGDITAPLNTAIATGNKALVKTMIDLGANPNGNTDDPLCSPLAVALACEDDDLINLIIQSEKFDPLEITDNSPGVLLAAIIRNARNLYLLIITNEYKKNPSRLDSHMQFYYELLEDIFSRSEILELKKTYQQCVADASICSTKSFSTLACTTVTPSSAVAATTVGIFSSPTQPNTAKREAWSADQKKAIKENIIKKTKVKTRKYTLDATSSVSELPENSESISWFDGALIPEDLDVIDNQSNTQNYLWLPEATLRSQGCDVSLFRRSRYHHSDQCIKPIQGKNLMYIFKIDGQLFILKATHELKVHGSPARILLLPIKSPNGKAIVYLGGKYLEHGLHNTKDTKSLMQSLSCLVPIEVNIPEKPRPTAVANISLSSRTQ